MKKLKIGIQNFLFILKRSSILDESMIILLIIDLKEKIAILDANLYCQV
jgi:hypothetical protein